MAEIKLDNLKQQNCSKMNSSVFDNFNKLKDSNDSIRSNAAVALLNHLSQYNTAEHDNKELNYAFTRLVRSLGSTTTLSRRGFYTTLTAFLTMHPETSIENLLSIMNKELHIARANSKTENADICIGRILLCGAIIRSKLYIHTSRTVETQQIIEILLSAGKERSYLSFLSSIFLSEIFTQLDTKSMKDIAWPSIKEELGISWSEHTLDTFYLLLVVKNKHPSLVNHKFLKEHLGTKKIIAKESMAEIVKLLTTIPRIISYRHPVYKLFCEDLMSTEVVLDFWNSIDQKFVKPSKSNEYVATKMLKLMLSNITDKTIIPSLLSPNFLRHMLKRFSNCKKNNNDEVLIAFKEILHLVVSATNDKDMKTTTQLNILKKLILYSGDLMIEKKTGVKVIQIITGNLKVDGIKKLCQLYRNFITNGKIAEESKDMNIEFYWTNAERGYIIHLLTKLMGHPEVLSDQDWRIAQLTFLFDHGLCEVSYIGVELAPIFKDAFYRALDYKLPKLSDARNLLSALVHDLNSKLQSNTVRLRVPLNDAASDAWRRVLDLIEKLEMNTENAKVLPIFHTMNLHMVLQLFLDPEMAIMSINELECCYEKLTKVSKKHKKLEETITEEEPQWVEVVVDLFLSLLSRNNHLLRSLVNCVFPHVCPYLTPSSVHQILAVLDVKNDQKTLTCTKQDDDEDMDSELDSDDDDDDDNENDDNEKEENANGKISSEESESDSNVDEDEDEDEDETVTDRLKMALRKALGDTATQTDDEDIDIDQIGEEEGRRLNQSLGAAFKIIRENRKARSKKQGKSSQTLMHFKTRVIDLLDIYLETYPSMAVTLDIVVPLFTLLESCIKDTHQKPLEYRVRNCLKKLSKVKKFKDTINVDDTLLTTILKALIEKGERSTLICQEMNDKLAECCTFIIRCTQQANLSIENIVNIYTEHLIAFFKKRDCVLSFMLFKSVLQLCWEGNWQLASLLVDFAFDSSIRYFRRSQAFELLIILYNNNRFLNMYTSCDKKYIDMRIKLETLLCKYTIDTLQELCDLHTKKDDQSTSIRNSTGRERKILQKFISHLFTLLHIVHAHHLQEAWNWQTVKTVLTAYKNQTNLSKDTKNTYSRLITKIGTSNDSSMKDNVTLNKLTNIILQSNSKQNTVRFQNGKTTSELKQEEQEQEQEQEQEEENTCYDNNEKKKKKKNKQKDKQLLKKEARDLRTKAMSQDLELFKFSSVHLLQNDVKMEKVVENENSCVKSIDLKLSQKRNHEQTTEENGKFKKRKTITNCV